MPNTETAAAWRYHDATKHSYASVHTDQHFLDWENQPLLFKIYQDVPVVPLPRELRASGVPALQAVGEVEALVDDAAMPDLAALAHLLYCAAGVTKRKAYPAGEVLFRAASCTGALYQIELYVACADLPGLAAGLYHFDLHQFALRPLRAGDYRGVLVDATAREPAVVRAPVVVVCTGTYWRNAWKYRARTYRHFGWDNGTLLSNLLATSAALRLPARLVCGFVDRQVNELLGVDTDREVAFSLVALGRTGHEAPPAPPLEPLSLETVRVSASEVDYPIMREVHAASSLELPAEVVAWRARPAATAPTESAAAGPRVALRPLSGDALPMDSIEEVIIRRGSTRQFQRGAGIGFEQLSAILERSTRGLAADFLGWQAGAPATRHRGVFPLLDDVYLIVHAVSDLNPGAYVLHRETWELELLKPGEFREEAGFLGLEQDLPADAAVTLFFLTDLHAVLERFGNRGYRVAQLEAGILGGRMYLAAYALRLGASGLTFYDDAVVQFFGPHAKRKNTVFCMTFGRSVKGVRTAERVAQVRFI